MPYRILDSLDPEVKNELLDSVGKLYDNNPSFWAMRLIPGKNGEDGADCDYEGSVVSYRIKSPTHTEEDTIKYSSGTLRRNDVREIAEHLLTLKQEGYTIYCGDDKRVLNISDNGKITFAAEEVPVKPDPGDDLNSVAKWFMKWLPSWLIPKSWTSKAEAFNRRMKEYDKKMNFAKAVESARKNKEDARIHTLEVDEGINKEFQNQLDKAYRIKLDADVKNTARTNIKKDFEGGQYNEYNVEPQYLAALLIGILAEDAWKSGNKEEKRAVVDAVINHFKQKNAETLKVAAALEDDNALRSAATMANSLSDSERVREPFKKDENGKCTLDYLASNLKELTSRFIVGGALDTHSLYLTELMKHTLSYLKEIQNRNPEEFSKWLNSLDESDKEYILGARGAIKMMEVLGESASKFKDLRSPVDVTRASASEAVLTGVLLKNIFLSQSYPSRYDELKRFGNAKEANKLVDEYKTFVKNSELHDKFKEDNGPEDKKAEAAVEKLVKDFRNKRAEDEKRAERYNNLLAQRDKIRKDFSNILNQNPAKVEQPKNIKVKAAGM